MTFTCPKCGAVSHNPNDARERYCGRCHQFVDDMKQRRVVRIPNVEHFHRLTHRLQARLPVWIVYDRGTVEYPNHFVARMHVALPEPKPTRFVVLHDNLNGLRGLLAPWLTRLERSDADAPEIIETWL